MLIEEAQWFGQKISGMDPETIFPMCNIGSSTADFRQRKQPWIDEFIFGPARESGGEVRHVDMKAAPGVDLVGDLTDAGFLDELKRERFMSVFCSNLLEHLENKEEIGAVLADIVRPGGYLFLSCPFRYPVHLDPIDTGFRPTAEELAALLPGTTVVDSETVTGGTYWDTVSASPMTVPKTFVRLFVPFYKYRNWRTNVNHLPWMFRHFQATCVILRKTG